MLGITGDVEGRAYWTDRIEAGLSRTDFVADFVTAALNFDAAISTVTGAELANAVMAHQALSNKVQVGLHFAAALGGKSNGAVDADVVPSFGRGAGGCYPMTVRRWRMQWSGST